MNQLCICIHTRVRNSQLHAFRLPTCALESRCRTLNLNFSEDENLIGTKEESSDQIMNVQPYHISCFCMALPQTNICYKQHIIAYHLPSAAACHILGASVFIAWSSGLLPQKLTETVEATRQSARSHEVNKGPKRGELNNQPFEPTAQLLMLGSRRQFHVRQFPVPPRDVQRYSISQKKYVSTEDLEVSRAPLIFLQQYLYSHNTLLFLPDVRDAFLWKRRWAQDKQARFHDDICCLQRDGASLLKNQRDEASRTLSFEWNGFCNCRFSCPFLSPRLSVQKLLAQDWKTGSTSAHGHVYHVGPYTGVLGESGILRFAFRFLSWKPLSSSPNPAW